MKRSSATTGSNPRGLFKSIRSKAYLFSGVEIRWKSAIDDGETPTEATFHFPGGLSRLPERNDERLVHLCRTALCRHRRFPGPKFGTPGKVEWAINWTPSRDGFIQSYCNTVPTPEGGTHVAGFWAAILKGIKAMASWWATRRPAQITRDDLITGGCALVSLFHPRAGICRPDQRPAGHGRGARLVENAVRDHFDNWLAADTKSAGAILDFLVLRAEERLRRGRKRKPQRKSATKKAASARQAGRLFVQLARDGTELFIVEGDSRGRLCQDGARPQDAGAAAPARQDP